MRRYHAEFNRVVGDNIRIAEKKLRRSGLDAYLVAHKTALRIERPEDMSWTEFKTAVRSVLQPRRGSVMLFSESSGKTYICNNAGNQPGQFERQ